MPMYQDVKEAMISTSKGEGKNTFTGDFCFKESLDVFNGHFPGMPVLPGVMQIEMILYVMEKNTGILYRVKKLKKAKFSSQIVPGEIITVALSLNNSKDGSINLKAAVSVDKRAAGRIIMTFVK